MTTTAQHQGGVGAFVRRSAVRWKNVLQVRFLSFVLFAGAFVGGRLNGDASTKPQGTDLLIPNVWSTNHRIEVSARRQGLESISDNDNSDTEEIEKKKVFTLYHSNVVTCITVTPDNKWIVSASRDDTIKIWSLSTGELVQTLVNHTNSVKSVAVTPDNTRIISASWDKTIKVWSFSSGELEWTFEDDRQHKFGVLSVAVSPDGARIVSGLADGSINIWSLITRKLEKRLRAHTNHIHSVAIAPAGDKFVSAGQDSTIKVWSFGSSEPDLTLKNHSASVRSVVVTADNVRIVSGSLDKTIRVWSLATGELERTIVSDSSSVVESVAMTADGNKIVAALRSEHIMGKKVDGLIQLFSLHTGALELKLGNPCSIGVVAATSDGSSVVSESFENSITVWQDVYREPTSGSTEVPDVPRNVDFRKAADVIGFIIGSAILLVVLQRKGAGFARSNDLAPEHDPQAAVQSQLEIEASPSAQHTRVASLIGLTVAIPDSNKDCGESVAVSSCSMSSAFSGTINSRQCSNAHNLSKDTGTISSRQCSNARKLSKDTGTISSRQNSNKLKSKKGNTNSDKDVRTVVTGMAVMLGIPRIIYCEESIALSSISSQSSADAHAKEIKAN